MRYLAAALAFALTLTPALAQTDVSDRLQMLSSRINADLPYRSPWGAVTSTYVDGNVLVWNATLNNAFIRAVGHNGVLEDFRKNTCNTAEFRRIIENYGVTFRMIAVAKSGQQYIADANRQTCVGAFGSIFP